MISQIFISTMEGLARHSQDVYRSEKPFCITAVTRGDRSTDLRITINEHDFIVNMINCVYRESVLTEEAEETEGVDISFLTDHYVGTHAPTSKGDNRLLILASNLSNAPYWENIMMLDAMLGHAKKLSYLHLQLTFCDPTPNYTAKRFVNRIHQLFHRIERYTGDSSNHTSNYQQNLDAYAKGLCAVLEESNNLSNDPDYLLHTMAETMYGAEKRSYYDAFRVSKKGLTWIKNVYNDQLCEVFGLRRTVDEEEDPEFYTQVFPDYESHYGVEIYTQIGYPKNKFLDDIEGIQFTLYLNLVTFSCKCTIIEGGSEWVGKETDLFNPDPRTIEEPIKGALSIVVDGIFDRLMDSKFTSYQEIYTIFNPGLETDQKKVNVFIDKLTNLIRLNYPSNNPDNDSLAIHYFRCGDGITFLAVGHVYFALALDGVGLVDVALDKEIDNTCTWEEIFYSNDLRDNEKAIQELVNNFEMVNFLNVAPQTNEGSVLLSEMGVTCARIMTEMANEEDEKK